MVPWIRRGDGSRRTAGQGRSRSQATRARASLSAVAVRGTTKPGQAIERLEPSGQRVCWKPTPSQRAELVWAASRRARRSEPRSITTPLRSAPRRLARSNWVPIQRPRGRSALRRSTARHSNAEKSAAAQRTRGSGRQVRLALDRCQAPAPTSRPTSNKGQTSQGEEGRKGMKENRDDVLNLVD